MKQNLIAVIFILLLISCTNRNSDTITQISTIDAIITGVYDGETKISELQKFGDTGIGTFNHLDGEMIMLDGKIHQIKSDGNVYDPPGNVKTPFACVTQFGEDFSFNISSTKTFNDIERIIDSLISGKNLFYAVKIKGDFSFMKTRSVPSQNKPYKPLTEITKNQPIFMLHNTSGDIVGFRCPNFVKGINVTGYHLHYINKEKTNGGHILDFKIEKGICYVDIINKFNMILPKNNKQFNSNDYSLDRSGEVKKAEK